MSNKEISKGVTIYSMDDDFDFRTEETESDVSIMKRVYQNEVVYRAIIF